MWKKLSILKSDTLKYLPWMFLSQFYILPSPFKVSIWVSSVNIADNWVKNITSVNIPNSNDSKPNKIIKIRVAAGEKLEHSTGKKGYLVIIQSIVKS